MFHPDFLKGKRALVTGSTSGIGLAIARALHEQGVAIVLNGFGDADGDGYDSDPDGLVNKIASRMRSWFDEL